MFWAFGQIYFIQHKKNISLLASCERNLVRNAKMPVVDLPWHFVIVGAFKLQDIETFYREYISKEE